MILQMHMMDRVNVLWDCILQQINIISYQLKFRTEILTSIIDFRIEHHPYPTINGKGTAYVGIDCSCWKMTETYKYCVVFDSPYFCLVRACFLPLKSFWCIILYTLCPKHKQSTYLLLHIW